MATAFPRLATLWLAPFLLLACSGTTPSERTVFEVVTQLPTATTWSEPRTIAPGQTDGRQHLGAGWWNQAEADGDAHFLWSLGPTSVIAFDLVARRDVTLRLDGRPFAYPGAPEQVVTVEFNGHVVGQVTLPPGRSTVALDVGADVTRVGPNRAVLRYAHVVAPRDVLPDNRDARPLAVAWYAIHLGDPTVGGGGSAGLPAPRADPDRDLLFLPYGSAVELFVDLPRDSTLVVDSWTVRGDGHLEIVAQPAGAGSTVVSRVDARTTDHRITLPGAGLTRIGLRARGGSEPQGGVGMVGGRVVQPDTSSGAATARGAPVNRGSDRATTDGARPNVLVYLIDTLRADHLGIYGHDRPISPAIDAWAAEAVVFEQAIAQSSWTKASVASILTGLTPIDHGANLRTDTLSPDARTLSEHLAEAGYATGAFVTNPNVTADFGFDQGYASFVDLGEEARAHAVVDAALGWLDARPEESDRPFFLYLHTLDPHAPYTPPDAFRRQHAPAVSAETAERSMAIVDGLQAGRIEVESGILDQMLALYDAEIATNDDAFGQLVAGLEARGLDDETIVIVVSDHGEEFAEHGNFQHGRALHRESIHVPLIIAAPGAAPGHRVARRVQHVDILPTILDLVGLPDDGGLAGTSLRPWLEGGEIDAPPPPAFSYLHLDGPARASVYDRDWKLIQQLAADHRTLTLPRLYDLAADPFETRERVDEAPVHHGYLAGQLRAWLSAPGQRLRGEAATLDDELRERLRALGYLD